MSPNQQNQGWAKVSQVKPYLYLGGAIALSPGVVEELQITSLINATREAPSIFVPGVSVQKLWILDTPETDISPWFDQIADQIATQRSQNGRVLVHCVAGVSRSAALVLAYLIKHEDQSLREAYNFLARVRPMVRPNIGFWHQLMAYERRVRQRQTVHFIQGPGCAGSGPVPDVYLMSTGIVEEEEEEGEEETGGKEQSYYNHFVDDGGMDDLDDNDDGHGSDQDSDKDIGESAGNGGRPSIDVISPVTIYHHPEDGLNSITKSSKLLPSSPSHHHSIRVSSDDVDNQPTSDPPTESVNGSPEHDVAANLQLTNTLTTIQSAFLSSSPSGHQLGGTSCNSDPRDHHGVGLSSSPSGEPMVMTPIPSYVNHHHHPPSTPLGVNASHRGGTNSHHERQSPPRCTEDPGSNQSSCSSIGAAIVASLTSQTNTLTINDSHLVRERHASADEALLASRRRQRQCPLVASTLATTPLADLRASGGNKPVPPHRLSTDDGEDSGIETSSSPSTFSMIDLSRIIAASVSCTDTKLTSRSRHNT